jgi:hypothetical protein
MPGAQVEFGGESVAAPPFLGIMGSAASVLGNTDVYLTKVWVPVSFTVNSIAFRVNVQNGNMQVGIYSSAGSELYDSGSFAVPATGARAHTTSVPVGLSPGWVYTAIQTSSATAQFPIMSGGIGVGFSFANTFANGLPSSLPALSDLATPVTMTLHA